MLTRADMKARLAELPDDIRPTMLGAWSAFSHLTRGCTLAAREDAWFRLTAKAAPGKIQLAFTEADWQTLIDDMKNALKD